MIGDHVEVKVIAVEGDQIKLGIVAPKSVKVHRQEVFESIMQQNREAQAAVPDFVRNLKLKK